MAALYRRGGQRWMTMLGLGVEEYRGITGESRQINHGATV